MNTFTRAALGGCVVAGIIVGGATPALSHEHLFNPSGSCPSADSSVPQGIDNPAGNTPGNRNNASENTQGDENCKNGSP